MAHGTQHTWNYCWFKENDKWIGGTVVEFLPKFQEYQIAAYWIKKEDNTIIWKEAAKVVFTNSERVGIDLGIL